MKLTVEGMSCGHCIRAITEAVRRLGATADVDLAARSVVVEGDVERAAVVDAIEGEGYVVTGVE